MNRTTLKDILCFQVSGNHLSEVNTNVKFELDFAKEIGRGGTCLVYHAYKILNYNGEELRHKVILKEFFPKLDGEDKILREKDGSLIIPNTIKEQALYKRKLQRFLHSYEMFVNLHNEEKTNNYIVDAYEMIEANGTWYIIADYNEAITLENYIEKQPNLYEFCQIMRNVSQAMSCFHDLEYLHLDLTPGNIMVFKDLSVRIMDTDSLLEKDFPHRKKGRRRTWLEERIAFSLGQSTRCVRTCRRYRNFVRRFTRRIFAYATRHCPDLDYLRRCLYSGGKAE